MNWIIIFLIYWLISFIALTILMYFWIREIKQKYINNENKFKREIESKKLLWVFVLGFAPVVIPFTAVYYLYEKIKFFIKMKFY